MNLQRLYPLKAPSRLWYQFLILFLLCISLPLSACAQFFDSTAAPEGEQYLEKVELAFGNDALKGIRRTDALALASTLGRLDRATLPPEIFISHLQAAAAVRERFYPDLSDKLFQTYLLPLRIRAELTAGKRAGWRSTLMAELKPILEKASTAEDAARLICDWVVDKAKVTPNPTETYALNLKGDFDPLSTLRAGTAREIDVAILAVAALRAGGVAARLVYTPVLRDENGGKVWVEWMGTRKGTESDPSAENPVWNAWVPSLAVQVPFDQHGEMLRKRFGGKWVYVLANPENPENITASYTSPTTLLWAAPFPAEEAPKFENMIMIWSAGRLQSVMGRDVYNLEPIQAVQGLGPGAYALAAMDMKSVGVVGELFLEPAKPGWFLLRPATKNATFTSGQKPEEGFEWVP